jgi:hypothetical protein
MKVGAWGSTRMSNYVPWYGKKRAGFKRREQELLRMLGSSERPEAIERAAQEVREARIRALKSDRARVPPCGRDDNDERLRQFDERIDYWASRSVEQIVAAYRERLPATVVHASPSDGSPARAFESR